MPGSRRIPSGQFEAYRMRPMRVILGAGEVLLPEEADMVERQHDAAAATADDRPALKLMRRLLKRQGYLPDAIVTDRLRSYGAALRDLGRTDRHVTGGRSNNRAEVSHQPTRRRERQRRGFRLPGSAQRFLATHAAVHNHFNVQRHLISRNTLRHLRSQALAGWREIAAA